jgi:hypothetical protein
MLLFLDGMAHYDTSRIATKYSTVDASNATYAVTAEGRFGNCVKRSSTTNSGATPSGLAVGHLGLAPLTTRLGPWTPTTGGVCGFAIKVDDLQRVSNSVFLLGTIFCVMEGAVYHVRVALNKDGTFTLCRFTGNEGSSGPAILAQSIEGLTEATWMYVEFKWVIHDTAGSFAIRVNGIQVLSYTGRTTQSSIGTSTLGIWNAVRVLGVDSDPFPFLVLRMCDFYLADLASTLADDVHDFLGDGVIATIKPNGVGASSGWLASSGANWDAVNDAAAPDDDATYVSVATPGVTDLYQFEDIPAGAIVKGAHLCAMLRKETAGSATVAPVIQPSGSGALTGPAQGVANTVYDRYVTQAYDLNPTTGVKFTASEINAGQFGLTKTV